MTLNNNKAGCQIIESLFAEWQPEYVNTPLRDFSGIHVGAKDVYQIQPKSLESATRLLNTAKDNKVALRFRAQGHSLNGVSLPKLNELVVSSSELQQVNFEQPGTVTVGSGVILWTLKQFLNSIGFDLPVVNDGYPGPTVGGYISSAGMGPGSSKHGGFWENVVSIRLVDGNGQMHKVTPLDPLFHWLFGSMGQLGFIYDAKLKIIPSPIAQQPRYAQGYSITMQRHSAIVRPEQFEVSEDEHLFWFTLLVPEQFTEEAHYDLRQLEQQYSGVLRFQERYNYTIRHIGKPFPPLFHSADTTLTATGAWGWLLNNSKEGLKRLLEFDFGFLELACSKPYYRRYVQSELPSGPEIYQRCFGDETYQSLFRYKQELDPKNILNPGSVFSD